MSPIEKLTSEQIARFPEFVERWTKIGLCTAPADRPRAEKAIHACYLTAELEPPKRIIWCGSPLSMGLTRAVVKERGASVWDSVWASVGAPVWASVGDSVWASVRDSVRDSVWASVRASVRDSVRDSVWASVGDSVWASVRDSVWDSVWASVGAPVWASVGDSVRDSVRDSVWASVGDSVRASVLDSVFGSHEAGWLSLYSFFREACGLKAETEKLTGMMELAESCGWIVPHADICFASERHNVLNRDERGRLHSLTGPACAYPDGFAIYAVHGVRVPERTITQPIELQWIEAEKNAEVRRVMIDRYGQSRYLRDSGAKLVSEDRRGKLWRKELDGDEPIQMVEVLNSTPEPDGTFKTYFLRVPPDVTTATQAVAWTFGIAKAEDYRPELET